ncbi:MAG: VOC family protein [Anaerolineae bacterium]|nr:VOC family protein [Anaerolineae bacterium]
MNLNYIILYVRDMDKSKTFYTESLGMTVLESLSSPTFTTLRPANGALIGLQDKAASQLPPRNEEHAGTVELSFEIEDIDELWQQWKEKGVELVTEPIDLPFGRYFMAKDPDGHYLSAYRFAKPTS